MKYIGFTGYARSGKDTIAKYLVEDHGYELLNLSNHIKEFFDDFTRGRIGLDDLEAKLYGNLVDMEQEEQIKAFMHEVAEPFKALGVEISAFTQDTAEKALMRDIFQRGGELIYESAMDDFTSELQLSMRRGEKIVVSRVSVPSGHRMEEISTLRFMGFELIEINRIGNPPASHWEEQSKRALDSSGLVQFEIVNNQPTAEAWERQAKEAAILLSQINIPKLE